jgi:autotransporter-associated beta strand protein
MEFAVAPMDSGLSGLFLALEAKGLLESTTTFVTGKFGRTPKINPRAGRDHYPRAMFCLMAGSGVLTKNGSGRLTLAGGNNYAGGPFVNGGTLQVGNANAIPSGPGEGDVTARSPAVLDLAGNVTYVNGLWGNTQGG